jgi:hypothetical protein
MLLLDKSPAEIWKMLLPKKNILFLDRYEYEELIFYYRNYVYFVHHDGAIVRMKKPSGLHKMTQEDLWERLFHEEDTFDYDDEGLFTIGEVLLHMGFVVPLKSSRSRFCYQIEVVNRLNPESLFISYELKNVSIQYALYYSYLKCLEYNEQEQEDSEYEVAQIVCLNERIERADSGF